MEPEVSCSQEPATGPYPEPDECSPHRHTLFNIPSMATTPKLSLSFTFSEENVVSKLERLFLISPKDSSPLNPKPTIGLDTEPVLSSFHPHNSSP